MKNKIFTVAAVSLCLLAMPCWAMDEDADISLNKAAKHTNAATTDKVATIEDAEDSSSSSSSDSESDNGQVADKKSKKFFVYIADRGAAMRYQHIVFHHNFSVRDFKRGHVKNLDSSSAKEFLAESRTVRKLCKIMKGALKKFGATQTLSNTIDGDRFIVELTTREEQSAKAVTGHCQESDHVQMVFSDEAELDQYFAGRPSTASSSSSSLESVLIGAFQGMGIAMQPFPRAWLGMDDQTMDRGGDGAGSE